MSLWIHPGNKKCTILLSDADNGEDDSCVGTVGIWKIQSSSYILGTLLGDTQKLGLGFSDGTVVSNLPCNAGDTGQIPDPTCCRTTRLMSCNY